MEYLEKWLFRKSINDRVNEVYLIKTQLQPFWYQRKKRKVLIISFWVDLLGSTSILFPENG